MTRKKRVPNPSGRPKKLGVREEKAKKQEYLEALEQNLGIITPTIKQIGLTRWYYDKWLREDPEFKEEVEKIKDSTLDFVESKLLKEINEGNASAMMFYLKCKGKERGYIEQQNISQEITYKEPLKINIIQPQLPENKQNRLEGDQKRIDKE